METILYKQINRTAGIYIITNTITNAKYIGSSNKIGNRINKHKSLLRNKKHFNNYLQNSFNKYGMENFTFDIYEEYFGNDIRSREKQIIEKEQSMYYQNGYNIDEVNEKHPISLTKEIKNKISNSLKGKAKSETHKHNLRVSKGGNYIKKIFIYSLMGDLIETKNSLYDFEENNINSIARVLRGERKTFNSKIYSFKTLTPEECKLQGKPNSKFSNVIFEKYKDGVLIDTYNGINALIESGYVVKMVTRVTSGKRNYYKGFEWKIKT